MKQRDGRMWRVKSRANRTRFRSQNQVIYLCILLAGNREVSRTIWIDLYSFNACHD